MNIHWTDHRGIFCGSPLFPDESSRVYLRGIPGPEVSCIDCRTIVALVEEAQDETEATETLLRERARYSARR